MRYTRPEVSEAAKELGRLLYSHRRLETELKRSERENANMRRAFRSIKQNTLSGTIRSICDEQLGEADSAVPA